MNGPGGSEGETLAVRPPARAGLGRTFFLSPFLTEGPDVCFLSPSPGRSTRYQSTVKALRSPAEKDVRFALPPPSVLRFLDGGFIHTRPVSAGPTRGSVDGGQSIQARPPTAVGERIQKPWPTCFL